MVWGYDAGTAVYATRFALKLKLLPVSLRIDGGIPSALEDNFCTFLCDTVCVRERERVDRQTLIDQNHSFPYLPKAP